MKVKNEYVQIKVGNKTYMHKNMILNEYLYKLFDSQLDVIHDYCYINECYIKLDAPIDVDYDSQISKNDFDFSYSVGLNEGYFNKFSNRNENTITINLNFNNSSLIVINGEYTEGSSINQFIGKKIMGIGFGNSSQENIFAYLDTRNMNIVINYNEEISIIRVDTLKSDGVCNGIEYPLHLVNDFADKDAEWNEQESTTYYTKAQLYSVGFGNVKGYMEEEYLISNLTTTRNNNSISFDLTRNKNVGKYPSNNLFPGFYPTKDNSKYLIFKYRLYRINNTKTNYYYLDEYYTMSMPNVNFGDLNVKLKIERI